MDRIRIGSTHSENRLCAASESRAVIPFVALLTAHHASSGQPPTHPVLIVRRAPIAFRTHLVAKCCVYTAERSHCQRAATNSATTVGRSRTTVWLPTSGGRWRSNGGADHTPSGVRL